MSNHKIEAWIKAGYKLLASDGLDGVKVERVARQLQLNKSGFYHYFGTMGSYMKKLREHHINQAKTIAKEISNSETIDPDLLYVIVKNKIFFLADFQLMAKRSVRTHKDFVEADKIVNEALLPLWRKTVDLSDEPSMSLTYVNILHHFFYARINSENINYKSLRQLAEDTRDVLSKVSESQHILHK